MASIVRSQAVLLQDGRRLHDTRMLPSSQGEGGSKCRNSFSLRRLQHSEGFQSEKLVTRAARNPEGKKIARCNACATLTTGVRAHTQSFVNVKTPEDLIVAIRHEVDENRLPARAGPAMEQFFESYRNAVFSSGVEDAEEVSVRVMATVFDRIMVQFEEPFQFEPYHKRLTTPYDYYAFGQNYVRPLINFKESFLGNQHIFDEIDAQVQQGHNVVLLSNHQTEADPAILANLLEASHPRLAQNMTYVAGDRVVLDPFCKPFSMGRNLLCVYSKKHINDEPELREQKMLANRRTLKEMAVLFKAGGQVLWIAPSGGRDRPDPTTDEWRPAMFDPNSVEMMRRLVEDAGPPGHLHALALRCYNLMPPPKQVEKSLGEQRIIGYSGVGVSVASEVDFSQVTAGVEDKKMAREVYSQAMMERVIEHYQVLGDAIENKDLSGGDSGIQLRQPWLL